MSPSKLLNYPITLYTYIYTNIHIHIYTIIDPSFSSVNYNPSDYPWVHIMRKNCLEHHGSESWWRNHSGSIPMILQLDPPLLMGKSTISMTISNSYVGLPEGQRVNDIYIYIITWDIWPLAIGTWDVPFQVNLVWYFDDSICCHKWGMCKANLLGKARYGFSVPDPFITPGPRPTKSQQLKAIGDADARDLDAGWHAIGLVKSVDMTIYLRLSILWMIFPTKNINPVVLWV